jgi:hypothetical protein
LENFFNRLLKPFGLKFTWVETDTEDASMRGSAMLTMTQALDTAVKAGFIERDEARKQIIADGLMTIEIDPDALPEDPMEKQQRMMQGQQDTGLAKLFGGNRGNSDKGNGGTGVPASQGGQTDVKPANSGKKPFGRIQRFFTRKARPVLPKTHVELVSEMGGLVDGILGEIVSNMGDEEIRRLIEPTAESMYPGVQRIFTELDEETIQRSWLPNMQAVTFDAESYFDSDEEAVEVLRAQDDSIRDKLEALLMGEEWWKLASLATRNDLLEVFIPAYERGLYESALAVARALYEGGLRDTPELIGINFELVNESTISNLAEDAATLVRRIDDGTRYYIKQSIIAGVREGLSSPDIARAIQNGAALEEIMGNADFTKTAIEVARNTLQGISEARANSIVNTEVNRTENKAHYDQYNHLGLRLKHWQHLGKRGVTDKGNEHPCIVCSENELAGDVPMAFEYRTVFKDETTLYPPGHPGVCHCKIMFAESDLFEVVSSGKFAPLTGS